MSIPLIILCLAVLLLAISVLAMSAFVLLCRGRRFPMGHNAHHIRRKGARKP